MKTLVLGLGNPILRDDGIGIHVARALQELLADRSDVVVKEASIGGLRLLDVLAGYDRAILEEEAPTFWALRSAGVNLRRMEGKDYDTTGTRI